MAGTMDDATASMIRNLQEKTGKSLEQWVALVRKLGEQKHGAVVSHLKQSHGLGHGYANLVAHAARGGLEKPDAAAGEDLVAAQFAGPRAALRPIYDRLSAELRRLGADVELAPKKAYVSVRRAKQFAILQASTATRFDVGINLKGAPPAGRLEASGSFNSMVSHRVRLESAGDVNPELLGWLRQAYDAAG